MATQMIHLSERNRENQDWIISMEGKINKPPELLDQLAGREACCIFRVPQSLVQINEKAYRPEIVSIGLYHYGKEHLKMIQEHKWRFLGAFLNQIGEQHSVGLNNLFQAIAPMEQRIRNCYSETIGLDSHDLIKMMILDGCFIIQLFRVVGKLLDATNYFDDPIFNMQWILTFLMRDLMKIENQIPFFVLQKLFARVPPRNENPSLSMLTLGFFNRLFQRPDEVLKKHKDLQGKHLLDLLRLSFIPPSSSQGEFSPSTDVNLIPPARKLHLAGIKFRSRETDSFLDIKFANGVLEMPPFTIDDFSSSFLLNCVAFEQCYYYHCSKHFTSYVTFLECLINTPNEDVVFDINKSYMREMFRDVNDFYNNNWHVHWAGFKHTYFDTPWSFMSALAALILLILTMIRPFLLSLPTFILLGIPKIRVFLFLFFLNNWVNVFFLAPVVYVNC
ncbi:hypothetical protein PTKIN_Ptkin11bG0054600 [Pterospermum kingtungense]